MTQHPRDEFDQVPESTNRQGVHRERLVAPGSSGLGLIVTVGLLALLVGLAAYFVLPRLGIGGDEGNPGASPSATASQSASASASASASPDEKSTDEPSASASAESSEPAAEETPEPSPTPSEPAVAVDRSQPVAVMNATVVPGLAGSAAQSITADGWAIGPVANWTGQPVQTSIIYYNGSEQLPNAQALGAYLGIPTVVDSAAASPLTVVLGPGYQ